MNGNSKRLPLAVDVGCGPGVQSTDQIAPYFDKVIGVDISQAQIEEAKSYHHPSNIEFWWVYEYNNLKDSLDGTDILAVVFISYYNMRLSFSVALQLFIYALKKR